jgi:type VII secretion-associated serine protease mycosin
MRALSAGALGALSVPLLMASPHGQLPTPVGGCPAEHGIAAPASTPWAQQALDYSSVWGLTRGAGVTVAVIDSGVDANPQFGDRVATGQDLAPAQGVPAGADCVGHGTSVASIIAAAPVPGVSFSGVAPAARILSIKITNSDAFDVSVAPVAIDDAVADGASVINLSLATTDNTPALRAAVDFALAHNVVVVAAAGNDSSSSGETGPFYPAAYPGVLSVGAVGPDGSLAPFSDTHTPVTVTAPGVDVTAAYPGFFPDAYNPSSDGTSFATGFVSGVAALVRAYDPSLTEGQVVARIAASADGGSGPGTGNGLVNPVQAVTAATGGSVGGVSGANARVAVDRGAPPDPATTEALTVAGGALAVMLAALALTAFRRRRPQPR